MESFNILLAIHNVLRWIVLVAGVAAIGGAWHGVVTGRDYSSGDRLLSVGFVASMHLQILLGLILYVQSPIVTQALDAPGDAMGNAHLRYFFVEHISMMILAAVVVQVGSILAKRVDDDAAKHKRAAGWFTAGAVIIVVGLHYVWMNRPMLPF